MRSAGGPKDVGGAKPAKNNVVSLGRSRALSRERGSKNVVASIRRADESCLNDFFVYFQPVLLEQARRMGIPSGNANEMILTFLDDKVIELAKLQVEPPSLAGYVIRAFRNRVLNTRREQLTRDDTYANAMTSLGSASQRIVAECHSEYSVRAALSAGDEAPFLRPALVKLSEFSAAQVSTEDIGLLMALGDRVPIREIAVWLGISYANCRVRAHRLRARLSKLAVQYVQTLAPAEREEVERFLQRATNSERRVKNG